VPEILKQRIGERVKTLKISWRRASLDAGLNAGFIQDLMTGSLKDPSKEAIASLATVLECSPSHLTGEAIAAGNELSQLAPHATERPDAVMVLKIVDELLAGGHVDAAHIAVKRALKEIKAE
jgi:hypothetical protein